MMYFYSICGNMTSINCGLAATFELASNLTSTNIQALCHHIRNVCLVLLPTMCTVLLHFNANKLYCSHKLENLKIKCSKKTQHRLFQSDIIRDKWWIVQIMCKLHHKATTERIFGDFTKTITKSDVHQKELQTKTLNLDEMVEMVES